MFECLLDWINILVRDCFLVDRTDNMKNNFSNRKYISTILLNIQVFGMLDDTFDHNLSGATF